jgi:Leucine-rich repeat (LRR) protein
MSIFTKEEILELKNIKSVTLENILSNYPNLKHLFLQRDKIRDKPIAINNLFKLNLLTLKMITQENIITFLQNSEKFLDLQFLLLDSCKIRVLQKKFYDFVNLTTLQITKNYGLKNVVFEKYKLQNLTNLNLSNNKMANVPESIDNLINLQVLFLSENNIVDVGEEIFNLAKLTKLDLSKNKIKKISDSIGNLQSLKELSLSKNKNLKKIPLSMSNLKQIERLELINIGLEYFPRELCYFEKLRILYLDSNKLEMIPREISNLTKLTFLSISMNNLKSLPIEIKNNSNFHKFLIYENSYSENLSLECEYYQSRNFNKNLDNLPTNIKEIRLYTPSCKDINHYYYNKIIKIPFDCQLYIDNNIITEEMMYRLFHVSFYS